MKFAFIKANSPDHSVKKMCQMLEVTTGGYYAWRNRPESNHAKTDKQILEKIQELHKASDGIYGSPEIHQDLQELGCCVSKKRVERIMRENDIRSVVKRKFKVITTDSKHNLPVAPNLLNREFKVKNPNQVWASDITYIRCGNRFAYLCVVKDLYNHEPIGWTLEYHMRKEMVITALNIAIQKRKPEAGLMFHSDRGSQYASQDFRNALKNAKMIQSMSRKGDCWDNAPMESFFKSLKVEEVYHKKYDSLKEARQNLFTYIEVFYIRKRRHASLGYKTPLEFLERVAA